MYLLEYCSYALAVIAIAIAVASVMDWQLVTRQHEKALFWFGFALLAIVIPYVKEVTFKGMRVVIGEMNEASQKLDYAAIIAKTLASGISATRLELIDGYRLLLTRLPEDSRKERVIRLSKLYITEMGIKVSQVKQWLNQLGIAIEVNEDLDDDYLDKLKNFQHDNDLVSDGIFGYQTYGKVKKLLSSKKY